MKSNQEVEVHVGRPKLFHKPCSSIFRPACRCPPSVLVLKSPPIAVRPIIQQDDSCESCGRAKFFRDSRGQNAVRVTPDVAIDKADIGFTDIMQVRERDQRPVVRETTVPTSDEWKD